MRKLSTLTLLAFAALGAAQVKFSEFAVNPRGGDNGQEFFELQGAAGTSLNGLWLLSIEGDGGAAGLVDHAVSLEGMSIGANGLFLLRDSATVLAGQNASTNTMVQDFDPDMENGSNTFMLVRNYTGYVTAAGENNVAAQSDVDANNDGTPDGSFYGAVLDAVGWTEGDSAADRAYGTYYGGADFLATNFDVSINGGAAPDYFYRLDNGTLLAGEYGPTASGQPYALSSTNYVTQNGTLTASQVGALTWTPGSANPNPVPEPATFAALGLGAFGLLRRRRA